jgi:hypothetical protein
MRQVVLIKKRAGDTLVAKVTIMCAFNILLFS